MGFPVYKAGSVPREEKAEWTLKAPVMIVSLARPTT
jgi:hypothetical protein